MTLSARDCERIAFLHAPHAVLVLAARIIQRASPEVEALFGWRPEELIRQPIRLLYPGPVDYEVIGARARAAMLQDAVHHDTRFMRHKDGRAIWVAGSGKALDAADPERLAVWTYRPAEGTAPPGALTPAETRVARYLVNGFTSKEIALALECSPRTVEVHRAAMIRKMKVRNSFELVRALLTQPLAG